MSALEQDREDLIAAMQEILAAVEGVDGELPAKIRDLAQAPFVKIALRRLVKEKIDSERAAAGSAPKDWEVVVIVMKELMKQRALSLGSLGLLDGKTIKTKTKLGE